MARGHTPHEEIRGGHRRSETPSCRRKVFVPTFGGVTIASRKDSARPDDERGDVAARRTGDNVEANARLTGSIAALLLLLLAAEGVTILRVRELISPHVFIGMLLIPPVIVKIASTTYRFARYYVGTPAYRRKGPPPPLLRLLGPFVVVLTVVVLASGVALLLVSAAQRHSILLLHKASFVLWFGAMTIHVLAHLLDTAKLAPRDWVHRTRRDVTGAAFRQWILVSSLAVGAVLGVLALGRVGPWSVSGPHLWP